MEVDMVAKAFDDMVFFHAFFMAFFPIPFLINLFTLFTYKTYQKVIIKELEDGIQFYSRGSNFTLNLKHASESDGSAEISARWDITLTYNEDGLLVEEIGETLNYHTNDALKAAFKCTYTYA